MSLEALEAPVKRFLLSALLALAAVIGVGAAPALAANCSAVPQTPTYGGPLFPAWNSHTILSCDTDARVQFYDDMVGGPYSDASVLGTIYFVRSNGPSVDWYGNHPCFEHGFQWVGSFWLFRVSFTQGLTWGSWHQTPTGPGSYGQCML